MIEFVGKPKSSLTNMQELNQLKQLCEKYDNENDSFNYSQEFNTILEKAETLDLAHNPALTEDLAYINLVLGILCYSEKDYEQALSHYNAAAYYYSKVNNRSELARAIQGLSDTNFMMDQYSKVLEYNPIVLKYYEEMKEEAKAADSNYYSAECCYQLDDYANAAEYSLRALAYYEKTGDFSNRAYGYLQLARIHYYSENYDDAAHYYKKSAKMHQQLGQLEELTTDYIELGDTYFVEEQNENAKLAYLDALAVLKEKFDLDKLRLVYKNLLVTCYYLDEYNEAITFGKKAIDLYRDNENQHDLIEVYSKLGDTYYYQNDYRHAILNYSQAEGCCSKYFEDDEDMRKKGQLNKDIYNCYYEMNDFDKAVQILSNAIEINKEYQFREELADNYFELGVTFFRGKKEPKVAYEYCLIALEILKTEDAHAAKGEVYELMGEIQLDINFHRGESYYRHMIMDDIINRLNDYKDSSEVDKEYILVKNRICDQAINELSNALYHYREAGEAEKADLMIKKINVIKKGF